MGEPPGKDRAAVMRRLSYAFLTWRRHHQRQLVPFGITLKQLHVLRQLSRNNYLHPSQIAEMLFCDRPTATVVVRNLGKQGWVERERDELDRRQVRVILTAKGQAKLDEITQTQRSSVQQQVDPLDCFKEHEIAELDRLLTKLNECLRQIAETAKGAANDPTE